ncbi:hypothetical protein D1953_20810 [Peribacillus asahii]|uniref:Uncharacterized protein n=1 Tax=Peribacillus asahii TaxID=228899 RepID=A0A398AUZ4_9BACI|nr:hypothetical protein D1953_20810 [Peribacillus asahii]
MMFKLQKKHRTILYNKVKPPLMEVLLPAKDGIKITKKIGIVFHDSTYFFCFFYDKLKKVRKADQK